MTNYFQVFFIGLTFSFSGPCFISCAPLLLPYFASSEKHWSSALFETIIFSLSRTAGYIILTVFVSISLNFFRSFFGNFQIYFKNLFSIFVIIISILIIFGKEPKFKICRILNEKLIVKSPLSMVILGFIMGILPCAPLVALLFEISLISKTIISSIFFGIAFGIGTTISPLLILAPLSNYIPTKIFRQEKTQKIFRITCGVLIFYLGIKYLFLPLPYQEINF